MEARTDGFDFVSTSGKEVEWHHVKTRGDSGTRPRHRRGVLYAKARVPEYWVVNLVDRVLEVFREPGDGPYGQRFRLPVDARVSPLGWPEMEIEVASLFPDEIIS